MRIGARPFAREYKSRSLKAMLQSPEKMVDLDIAAQRRDKMQKDAEAVFRQDEFAQTTVDCDAKPLFTGRVLPCLRTKVTASDLVQDEKPSAAHRSKRSSSTIRLAKPRLKQSRKIAENSNLTHSTLRNLSMSDEFVALSDLEILSLIERAKVELVRRRESGKEQLRAEIEAKLKNAGLELGDLFVSERKTARGADGSKEKNGQSSVVPKFKNHVSGETWSGRGRSPKWVVVILQERQWSVEDFKQSDEFLIVDSGE